MNSNTFGNIKFTPIPLTYTRALKKARKIAIVERSPRYVAEDEYGEYDIISVDNEYVVAGYDGNGNPIELEDW